MTLRQERLNARIMEVLSTVIQSEMRDPRLQMLRLSQVRVNRDASHAVLYYYSDDDEADEREIDGALQRAKGYLRGILAEALDLRYTPDLSFRYDHSVEGQARMEALFARLEEERLEEERRQEERQNDDEEPGGPGHHEES